MPKSNPGTPRPVTPGEPRGGPDYAWVSPSGPAGKGNPHTGGVFPAPPPLPANGARATTARGGATHSGLRAAAAAAEAAEAGRGHGSPWAPRCPRLPRIRDPRARGRRTWRK
ncbi:unnamed protein product [Lampetra planeri]